VDADTDTDKLETFLSSSPTRKFGEPDTFNAVTLAKPLAWESSPPVLGMVAAKYPGTFFQPGRPVPSAWLFANVAVGYQYGPEQPSPSIVPIPLGTLKMVGRVGDVDVIAGPSPDGPELTDDGKAFWLAASLPAALWTFRGGAPIAHRVIGDGVLAGMANRGDTLHMLVATEGTFSRLGTGTCGACPTHALSVLAIDTSGRITELPSDQIGESVGEDDGQGGTVEYSDVTLSAEKDLSRFGFSGGKTVGARTHEVAFKKSWRWDAAAKRYVEEK